MEELVRTGVKFVSSADFDLREFLRPFVANGAPSEDTLRGYETQVKAWLQWCQDNFVDPSKAMPSDVRRYRDFLKDSGYKPASIAHKLAIIRQFYSAAIEYGMHSNNPAIGVKPPANRRAQDDIPYLTEAELIVLFRAVPKRGTEKDIRDRLILAMLGLQCLRTIEIMRANVEDIRITPEHTQMTVRGKGHDRVIFLRPDIAQQLQLYLDKRVRVVRDEEGTPLFTACGNRVGGKRISRRGIRQIVDHYLTKAELKRPGLSDHALRHTGATLAYKYTQDLRGVQDMLGHRDPKTTARYAHIVDRAKNNPALSVPVQL